MNEIEIKSELEREFEEAMSGIYVKAKEIGYVANRFLEMIIEMGGVETARILINTRKPSEGYTALWERKRLDITVEALVQDPKWQSLFSCEEIERARKRLHEYGYPLR